MTVLAVHLAGFSSSLGEFFLFLMWKVPVSLYFLTMSLAVEGLMDSLLAALKMEIYFSRTS